ncbi:hypothetical protein FA13DRAFT_1737145, partial [Coprinellus micaceus]
PQGQPRRLVHWTHVEGGFFFGLQLDFRFWYLTAYNASIDAHCPNTKRSFVRCGWSWLWRLLGISRFIFGLTEEVYSLITLMFRSYSSTSQPVFVERFFAASFLHLRLRFLHCAF